MYVLLCNCHLSYNTGCFHHPRDFFHSSFQLVFTFIVNYLFLSPCWFCLLKKKRVSRIMQWMFFLLWPFLLSMLLRIIQIVVYVSSFSLYCWVVLFIWKYHKVHIQSPIDRYLGYFQFFGIKKKSCHKYCHTNLSADLSSHFSWVSTS